MLRLLVVHLPMQTILILNLRKRLKKRMRMILKLFKKKEKRPFQVSEGSNLGSRKDIKIFQLIISCSQSMSKWRKRSDMKTKLSMKTLSAIFAKKQKTVDLHLLINQKITRSARQSGQSNYLKELLLKELSMKRLNDLK